MYSKINIVLCLCILWYESYCNNDKRPSNSALWPYRPPMQSLTAFTLNCLHTLIINLFAFEYIKHKNNRTKCPDNSTDSNKNYAMSQSYPPGVTEGRLLQLWESHLACHEVPLLHPIKSGDIAALPQFGGDGRKSIAASEEISSYRSWCADLSTTRMRRGWNKASGFACMPGLRVCPLSSIYWLVN